MHMHKVTHSWRQVPYTGAWAAIHSARGAWGYSALLNSRVRVRKSSLERLTAAISGGVVSAVALATGEPECRLDYDCWVRANSRISMDTTHSVCPFWSQKLFSLQSHQLLQDVFHIAVNDHSLSANSSTHCFSHVGQLGASDRCLRLLNFPIHQGNA